MLPTALAAEQMKENTLINSGKITEVLIFLLVVIALIFILAYFAKKFRLTTKFDTTGLEVTRSIPLTTKDRLVIIKTKKENILLGLSPGRISYLCHLDSSELEYGKEIE